MSTVVTISASDRRLAVIAGAGVLFALMAAIARWTGAMPAAAGMIVVVLGVAIALRVAWSFAATSASSAAKARTLTLISNVGLGISGVTLLVILPRLTQTGGVALMLSDILSQLWPVAILTVVAGAVRTLGWRVFAGMFLSGFLALGGLARAIGRPIIESYGTSSAFAVGLCIPFAEEACKLIPVVIILFVALRSRQVRPAALDIALIGAWAGAGFAVYENTSFGRGGFSLTTNPLLSLLYPMSLKGHAFGWPVIQVGHVVHTTLIALAIAFYFLYRKRVPRAWIVPVVSIASVLIEHCSQNAIAAGGLDKIMGRLSIVLTLDGALTSILLALGVGYVAWLETRASGGQFHAATILQLPRAEAARRSALLAAAQGIAS